MDNQIHIKVSVPEEIPAPMVIVAFRPKTTAEFEAIIAALGGPAAGFAVNRSYAALRLSDAIIVHVNEPEDAPPPVGPRPFMLAFGAIVADAAAREEAIAS